VAADCGSACLLDQNAFEKAKADHAHCRMSVEAAAMTMMRSRPGEFPSRVAKSQGWAFHAQRLTGKLLFASKGCVVCHQVNGVGGADAAPLDADTMEPVMSPFEFFAMMWRGAGPMIAMQRDEIGGQIEFTGQDLADIIAFAHNQAVQGTFSENDIPENIKALMQEGDEESGGGMEMKMEQDGGGVMKDGQ
jgi:mono/diheme cytochrome c family protein